ncbi:conserved hypothetical protein [Candidatus Desulfosporosinus infrequens]|uniref:Uncharacterized protein n=1 Tax=Candidatus Desulfosporosinus infrequens TaxID=2043169 RepID=A0A2U3LIN8_9FIRM|nr:conserved hypothetical protein [Candidatus Desulfosporosinus infrequens]
MSMAPMNPFMGEVAQTNVTGLNCLWLQKVDYQISPIAPNNTTVLANTALTASVQTLATGITNPDVARNTVVKGAIATSTGNVVVTGTDIGGNAITETIALSGTTVVAGNKAFAAVMQIVLPVTSGAGDGVSVGIGSKLGLPYTFTKNMLSKAYNNNVLESTTPTMSTPDPVNLCNNTITLASTLAGNLLDILLDVPG